ncbi:MAG: MerR family transcriptional regulator, partial [Chitinivibrionales bacterium]|nr:MerR family transcriptional regulator [Chitinivibrionales bacterium]MBD3358634.1 MerR family transcriptional regulator [Chitinivibrionales bacterium]
MITGNSKLSSVQNRKTYYSIREVCAQTGLEPHVLRYWETEFPQLRPKKNRAGNRAYREKDIELIFFIKNLLYEEQYTIAGAKKKITESRQNKDIQPSEQPHEPQPQTANKETVRLAIDELKGVL